MKNKLTDIERHVAGAIVQHNAPFENPKNLELNEPLSQEFINRWVVPFYHNQFTNDIDSFLNEFKKIKKDLNHNVVKQLLGNFNWRSRIVGGFFCAILRYQEFEDIIGKLFLKSELCYAGTGYCLALASFGTENSKKYLKKYLDYYLKKKDLYFEQVDAMSALNWIDKKDSTNLMSNFLDDWNNFISDKENWNLDNSISRFNKQMDTINLIRKNVST